MSLFMEDLPEAVQLEIRTKRGQVEGWDPGCHATVDQWMTYYAMLSMAGQVFLVHNLLELAQQGSLCQQADHQNSVDASWNQLTEVVKLHNARVDEVTALRKHIAILEQALGVDRLGHLPDRGEASEPVAEPLLPQDTEFLPVSFDGELPTDRRLYVVRETQSGHDEG